jgi:hypothetical protein
MSTVHEINEDLLGVTIVTRLEFRAELTTGRCSVVIELVDDERRPTVRVVVEANDVSNFGISAFGGGVTQLLCLHASSIAHLQHDRAKVLLEELEQGSLALKCNELNVIRSALSEGNS